VESATLAQNPPKTTPLTRILVVFGIFVFLFYVFVTLEWQPVVYMLLLISFLLSLYNYELNFAFLIFWVHVAAMLHPKWDMYAANVRFLYLFLFAARVVMGSLPGVVKGKRAGYTGFHVGLLLFAVIVGASTIDAYVQPVSLYRVISVWWLLIALGIVIWRYMDNREKIVTWLKISVIISTCFLFISLFVQDWFSALLSGSFRFRGLYLNPNAMGVALIYHLPCSFFLYVYARGRPDHGSFSRLFFLGAFILGVFCLLLTGSRASIGGLIIGGMAGLTLYYRSRIILIGFIVMLIVGAGISIFEEAIQSRLFQNVILRKGTIETMSDRERLWEISIKLFKEKPFWGYGFGTSDLVISSRGNPELLDTTKRFGLQSHNSFLRGLLEMGLVGTSFLIMVVIALPLKFLGLISRVRSKELLLLLLTLFVIFLSGLMNSIFESWLESVGSIICFLYWLSVTLIYRIDVTPDDFVEPGDTPVAWKPLD